MRIIKRYDWHRRDFNYDEVCENCGNVHKNKSGYDDEYFYNEVVPNTECKHCVKSRNDLIKEGELEASEAAISLKYNPNQTI